MPLCEDKPVRKCRCDNCVDYFKWGTGPWASIMASRRQRPRRSNEGARFGIGEGSHLTVNPTDNPDAKDGWYQTTTDADGNKSTAVYDKDGDMPPGKRYGDNDRYK